MEQENPPIILDVCWDADDPHQERYFAQGNANRRNGPLIFRHEYDVTLNKDLSFESASSIDCGEVCGYSNEGEFEANYPGVLKAIRDSAARGALLIRRYDWDDSLKRNIPKLVNYPEEA